MDGNKWLSLATFAGLFGLVILNAGNSVKVVDSLSNATNSYVRTVQGAGFSGSASG